MGEKGTHVNSQDGGTCRNQSTAFCLYAGVFSHDVIPWEIWKLPIAD